MTDATLSEILKESVDNKLKDYHTCLPGLVVSYNRAKQTASIQPTLKRKYKDGRVVNLPIINNVQVLFPRNKDKFIHFDLEKDDNVTLIFSERSLDKWKEKGGIVSPDDPRTGSLSDAYAFPSGFDLSRSFTPTAPQGSIEINNLNNTISIEKSGNILLKNESSSIKLDSTGKIDILNQNLSVNLNANGDIILSNGGLSITCLNTGDISITSGSLTILAKNSGKISISNGADELITLLSDLIAEIIGAKTLTMMGLQPLIGFTQTFPTLKTKIDGFKI